MTSDATVAICHDRGGLEYHGGHDGHGLSTPTVASIHGVLHKALEDAVKRDKVPRNVADAVDPPQA